MHQSRPLSIGWDVQKESLAVASVAQEDHAEVVSLGTLGTRQGDSDQLLRKMQSTSQPLILVSEAGPCGSGLYRSLTTKGQVCWGVAPSLSPKKPGERVQTTRRDAITLARRMRSGALTPVSVPTVDEEAIRDLCRVRADASRALKTAQWRLQALLLRHDRRYTGRAPWGPAPLRWLREVVCPTPAQPIVFPESIRVVTAHPARLARLAPALTDQVQTWRLAPVVEALPALRGGPCTVAVTTGAARGALTRVAPPRPLMTSLGFTPSADSTGARRRQGGRTKTGHSHARRALVAGAWAARSPATVRRHVPLRLAQGTKPIHAMSGQAQRRRCQRYRQLRARGTHANQVVVAIAREGRACMWAMAQEVALTPSRATMESPAAVCPRC